MTTSHRIEKTRKDRIKDAEIIVVSSLQKLVSQEISLNSDSIWESFRNGLLRGSDLTDMDILDYCKSLLQEYNLGSPIAKKEILDLAIDPLRQNISEEIQKEVAKEKGIHLEKLKQSGPEALRLYNGNLYKNSELSDSQKELATKALDFQVKNSQKKILTYNKYNKWVGGSTDDVFKDVRHLIEEFNKSQTKTFHLIIILDGNYWDLNRNKFNHLQNDFLTIISSDDLNNEIL